MGRNKKILTTILAIAAAFTFENVYAGNVDLSKTNKIICDNGHYFEIDGNIDGQVFYNKLTTTGFGLDYSDFNKKTYSDGISNFKYSYANSSAKCYNSVTGSASNYNYYVHGCNEKYVNQAQVDTEQTLDINTGKITIKVSLTGALATQINRIGVNVTYPKGSYGSVTKDTTNKKIIISGVSPADADDTKLYIHLYIANPTGSDFDSNNVNAPQYCANVNGTLGIDTLETIVRAISNFTFEDIENQYVNSETCKAIKEYPYASESFKKSYVPECYNEKLTVGYDEYTKIPQTIAQKYGTIVSIFKQPDPASLINQDNLKCTNSDLGLKAVNIDGKSAGTGKPFESKTTLEYNSGKFAVVCNEEYYLQADDPQLAYAGDGVEYYNRIEIDRTCRVYSTNVAHKAPPCQYHTTYGVSGHGGGWSHLAGPNDDFDTCVKECDNGEYSIECVNACYEKVYNDDDTLFNSTVKKTRSDFTDYVMSKIAVDTSLGIVQFTADEGDNYQEIAIDMTRGAGYTFALENGLTVTAVTDPPRTNVQIPFYPNPETGQLELSHNAGPELVSVTHFYDQNGVELYSGYSSGSCIGSSTIVVNQSVSPPGCGDNSAYYAAVAAAKSDYARIANTLNSEQYLSPIKDYTITFTDSVTGKQYSVSGSTLKEMTGVTLDIEKDPNLTIIYPATDADRSNQQIGDDDWMNNIQTTFRSRVVYNINIPKQYTLKNDANTIIVEGTDGYYKKVETKTGYKFEKMTVENKNLLSSGENVYYTDLHATDKNVETYTEATKQTNIFGSGADSTSLLSTISNTAQIKGSIPANTTREQLMAFWSDPAVSQYLSQFSYNAYAAYINNNKLVVKSLIDEEDNISVSFQIGTTGDVYTVGTKKDFNKSEYKCYYGVYNMLRDKENTGDLRYYYHEINLEDVFDGREPRWNWTGTITGNKVTGAAAKIDGYIVDPERLIAYIENNGNKIYTDEYIQQQEMDYEYTLTNSIIKNIRSYNKTKVKGKKIPYTEFTLAVANNTKKDNFSTKVAEWLGGTFKSREISISACNNSLAGSCYNYNIGGK